MTPQLINCSSGALDLRNFAPRSALLEIRDKRLYRRNYSGFEDYCRGRWGMSRQRAHQLIEAAGIVENLSTTVDTLPASERQLRPLTQLTPEDQRKAWVIATQIAPKGKPTALSLDF